MFQLGSQCCDWAIGYIYIFLPPWSAILGVQNEKHCTPVRHLNVDIFVCYRKEFILSICLGEATWLLEFEISSFICLYFTSNFESSIVYFVTAFQLRSIRFWGLNSDKWFLQWELKQIGSLLDTTFTLQKMKLFIKDFLNICD